ncbi:hypothetical protein C8P69_1422 [Phreatobacter oligotrophus]|uniref:Uncharacterized protein n=1 Tax=Phreatobacter oligotrophus TaxID=1122261 RepID=A0A2T4YLC7_9HYPH|nr:hypothetical protein C8P69_1422 [Phreatobacter oligotrophus]
MVWLALTGALDLLTGALLKAAEACQRASVAIEKRSRL